MGRVEGKVAFVTGAARGQGRADAVRLAEEGSDIIAVDLCAEIETAPYALGSEADLAETAAAVRALGRRVVTATADVRDREQLGQILDAAVDELGRLDIVVANAGIWSHAPFLEMTDEQYRDMIDVNQHGVYNTCRVAVPHLLDGGGSVIMISSSAGLKGAANHVHYSSAKHAMVGLMRSLANEFSQQSIRFNTVHPTSVFTPMSQNQAMWKLFAPEVENPTYEDFGHIFQSLNLLPVPWVEAIDVANLVLFLASDEARYITGTAIPVDAGFNERV